MKICTYCNREYPDKFDTCTTCGNSKHTSSSDFSQTKNQRDYENKERTISKSGWLILVLTIILGAAFLYPIGISIIFALIFESLGGNGSKAIGIAPYGIGFATFILFIKLFLSKTREAASIIITILIILALLNASGCVMALNGLSKIGQ